MASYANRIADMVVDYPNTFVWRQYDILFRKRKSKYYDLKWEVVYYQLLLNAIHLDNEAAKKAKAFKAKNGNNGNNSSNVNFRGRGRRGGGGSAARTQGNPRGTCNIYNNGNNCTFSPCKFLHVCSTCRGAHPRVQCAQGFTADGNN